MLSGKLNQAIFDQEQRAKYASEQTNSIVNGAGPATPAPAGAAPPGRGTPPAANPSNSGGNKTPQRRSADGESLPV